MSLEIARTNRGAGNAVVVSQHDGGGQVALASQSNANTATEYIPEDGEMGLLEVLYNTRNSDEKIPVCSRPIDELDLNFTDYEGKPVRLSNSLITKGKMGLMQEQLTGVNDAAVISGRDFKGIAGGLPGFMEPEYVLVAYKDYSQWALKHHRNKASGSWMNPFGKKHVKEHFAVEVGAGPGVFHELTEQQFIVGCHKVHRSIVDAKSGTRGPASSTLHGLTQEQFSAISNIKPEAKKAEDRWGSTSSRDTSSNEPKDLLSTIISYTPLGYYRRVRDETYRALGSAVVTIFITSVTAYLLYSYFIAPFIGRKKVRSSHRQRSAPPSYGASMVKDAFDTILMGGMR